jgi:hypothetical protein
MRQLETLNDAHNQRHYQTTWPTQKFNIKTALCADIGEWADGIELLLRRPTCATLPETTLR